MRNKLALVVAIILSGAAPFAALAFTTAPTPPADCTALITGYSNADPSSAVHCENVYDGNTWQFRGCIRLSTDGSHEISSPDYGTAGYTCDTAGHTFHLLEMATNSGECDGGGVDLATCQAMGDYISTVSWTVPGGVVGGGGSSSTMSIAFLSSAVDTINNTTTDYFQVLLQHYWPFMLGFLILLIIFYNAYRIIRRYG